MIDKYKDVVKFAFMTTDPETCTNNNNNCGFSYGHGFNGVNLGARGPDAGEELSGLLTVATTDAQTDINTNNSNVEKRIENLIPYGSTPIAAFFEDALHYFKNDPQVKPYSGGVGDQFYDCRLKRIIFITDGVETNILGTNRTATEVITELFNLGIETYVIGYALSTAEKDVSLLTEMARAGRGRDDVDFYNAADGDALRKALAEIMVDIQGSLRTFGTPLVTNRTGNLKDLQFECYYGDRKNLISAIDRSGEIQCIAYRCTCPPPTGEPDDGTVQPCETYSLTDNYRDKMLSGWNPTTYTPIQHRGTRGRSTLATGNGIPNDMAPLSDTNLTVLLWGEEYMTRLLNLVPTTITNTTNNLLGITTTDPCKDTTTWVDGGTVTDSTSKTGDESTTAPSLSWTTVKPQTNTVEYFDWSRCAANKKALWAEIVATSTSRRWPDGYGPVTHAEIIEPPVADINNASFELFKEQRKNDPTMLYALTADGKVMAHKLSWEGGQSQDFGPVIWSYVPGCLQPYLRQWQGGGDINLMGGKFQVRHVRYKVSLSTLTATSGVNKASEEWRTVMVGCTGAVSQCCFGLDITDPNNFFVRWETRPGRRCFLKEKGTEGSQLDDEWVCYESPIDWDNDSADVVARKFGEFGSMSVQPEIGNIFRVVKGESFTEAVTVIPTGYALTRQKDGVDYRLGGGRSTSCACRTAPR